MRRGSAYVPVQAASGEQRPCCTTVLAWRLRPVLSANPDMFLQRGAFPETVRRAVRGTGQCPLPKSAPAAMPMQLFGQLPPFLRTGFWRGLRRRLSFVRAPPAGRPVRER